MTPNARVRYHKTEWPAACAAQGWSPNDTHRRRNVCLDAMFLVKGPQSTTSDPKFGAAETTALFTYLRHLAEPENITIKLRWDQCMADYVAFNEARQADYWENHAYGPRGAGRWARQRFANKRTAQGDPAEDAPDHKQTHDRLMTMRARAQGRSRKKPSVPSVP
jgi:hypothetical protein